MCNDKTHQEESVHSDAVNENLTIILRVKKETRFTKILMAHSLTCPLYYLADLIIFAASVPTICHQ